METSRYADPDLFADAIEPLGVANPVEYQFLRTALWPGVEIDGHLFSDGAEPVGAMLPLGPRLAINASHHDPTLIEAMANAMPDGLLDAPVELLGPPELVTAIAGRWSENCGGSYQPVETLRTYVAEQVSWPVVDGEAVLAQPDALDHLFAWGMAMLGEIGEQPIPKRFRIALARRHAHQQFWYWVVDGAPVAQLFRSREAYGFVRIGGVYTPPELRGHRYGAALTAAVTARLQHEGISVMLITQARNASSNRIYRRIGYRSVNELLVVRLSAMDQTTSASID